MKERIKRLFCQLSRTQKVEFISENIQYASAKAIADYERDYLFDVLQELDDDDYVANYLRDKGYKVTK